MTCTSQDEVLNLKKKKKQILCILHRKKKETKHKLLCADRTDAKSDEVPQAGSMQEK